jgi:hypothetical protein
MAQKQIHIWSNTSGDPQASVQALIDKVVEVVQAKYPGYVATFHKTGDKNGVQFIDDRDDSYESARSVQADQEAVSQIVSDVRSKQAKIVEEKPKEVEPAPAAEQEVAAEEKAPDVTWAPRKIR